MTPMKVIAFVILIMLVAIWPVRAEDCGKYADHVGYRECLERTAKHSEAKLVRAEKQLRQRIMLWDAESSNLQRTLRHFDQDLAAYRRYRESHCEFKASLAAGGNGASGMRLSCRIELDGQRLVMLREIIGTLNLRRG